MTYHGSCKLKSLSTLYPTKRDHLRDRKPELASNPSATLGFEHFESELFSIVAQRQRRTAGSGESYMTDESLPRTTRILRTELSHLPRNPTLPNDVHADSRRPVHLKTLAAILSLSTSHSQLASGTDRTVEGIA